MNKPKILVSSLLPGNTQNSLGDFFDLTVNSGEAYEKSELLGAAAGMDAIICNLTNKIDEEFFTACPTVKLVANVAVGYDNIDLNAAKKHGVIVSNTPGVLTETTADLAFSLLLATARRTPEAENYLREGKWTKFSLDLLLGVDIHHKTLGIIGLGRIGQAVAARARGFSMKIIYSQRNRVSEEIEHALGAHYCSLDELLLESDFVSIHCPLSEESRHLIGKAQLEKMKRSAFLINTARGAIVNEQELISALSNGTISGAGLDVFENEPLVPKELLELKNVVLLPHIGSASIETRTAMGQLAVNAVSQAFAGRQPSNLVNPDSWNDFVLRLNKGGSSVDG